MFGTRKSVHWYNNYVHYWEDPPQLYDFTDNTCAVLSKSCNYFVGSCEHILTLATLRSPLHVHVPSTAPKIEAFNNYITTAIKPEFPPARGERGEKEPNLHILYILLTTSKILAIL